MTWRQDISTQVFDVYDAGNIEQAQANLLQLTVTGEEIIKGYEEMAHKTSKQMQKNGNDIVTQAGKTLYFTIANGAILLMLAIAIALIISNRISKPIQALKQYMSNIIAGDISQPPLETKSKDEVGQLTHQTNSMQARLNTMLTEIQQVAHEVSSSSEQLTQSAIQVASGSNQISTAMGENRTRYGSPSTGCE